MKSSYLFGPVPSRRLGISLGIDLVPHKTCSFNCIFCECGRTTNLTTERREYVPTADVIAELDRYLSGKPVLDYITFSGSGEPTLHIGIGDIVRHLKKHHPEYRLALLTNASLLHDSEVRNAIMDIDVIVPSLNAASQKVFMKINRPDPVLKVEDIIRGLELLRAEYDGEIWLEIFIVPGLNDQTEELDLLKKAIDRIKPDRIQLNTLDRPGVVDWIRPATHEEMEHIITHLGHPSIEITGTSAERANVPCFSEDLEEAIIQTLRRRPCTIDDLTSILGLHQSEINKYLQYLLDSNIIVEKIESRGIFYVLVQ